MNCAFPGDKGERESNLDQGTCSMCSGSSIKSFGFSDLQFSRKSYYLMSRNRWCDIQNGYKTILEHLLTIWFDSGSIGNLKIILILAGLMIALTSISHEHSSKTNNIQSDHQQECQSLGFCDQYIWSVLRKEDGDELFEVNKNWERFLHHFIVILLYFFQFARSICIRKFLFDCDGSHYLIFKSICMYPIWNINVVVYYEDISSWKLDSFGVQQKDFDLIHQRDNFSEWAHLGLVNYYVIFAPKKPHISKTFCGGFSCRIAKIFSSKLWAW